MVLLFVRKTTGQVLAVDADVMATVAQLKETIELVESIDTKRQTLIFAGRVLKNEMTLTSYNISKECSIQLFTSALKARSRAPSETDENNLKENDGSSGNVVDVGAIALEVADHHHHHHRGEENEGGVSDSLKHGDVVIIKLIEARNLEKADFWPGSSDPYAIFALGNNSAKSKIMKRNLNPVWRETFGFRINEEDDSAVLRVLVFDFDNFTPDDFIGSVEINLSNLKRGETVDTWVDLENVKTGQLHLQFRRSILTSPSLNAVVTSLMELERSWTEEDLARFGVTLEQLSGDTAWIVEDTTNPAIEHLAESVRNGSIDWSPSSLTRIETILESQSLLPAKGSPSRHLWFSGIPSHVKPRQFMDELRKHSIVKHVKFPTGNSCALVDFRSIGDALLCFLQLQQRPYHGSQLLVGFGRYLPRDAEVLQSCVRAGFLLVYGPGFSDWQLCWLFLTGSELLVFDVLQSEKSALSMPIADCFICSQGLNALEVYRLSAQQSIFLRSDAEEEVSEWKNVLRSVKAEHAAERSAKRLSEKGGKGDADDEFVKDEHEQYCCSICDKSYKLDEVYVRDSTPNSGDYACLFCLRGVILEKINSSSCSTLGADFTVQDIRELLSPKEFETYLDASLKELLDADENFVKCPKCSVAVEFVQGQDVPDFARLMGIDGRPMAANPQQHYLANRLRCRNTTCPADFCRTCLETPYHSGFSCDEYKIYKIADHCRFCDAALIPRSIADNPPSDALKKVCNAEECLVKRDQACTKTLSCGHPCQGVRDEKYCPPCLWDTCKPADAVQDLDDFCNICFTEALSASPIIRLECGHFFHFDCARRRLRERWPTPQITFGFCECPLCKTKMHHELLMEELEPIFALHRDIEMKSYQRLEYESLLKDPEISSPDGTYYRNAAGFGLKHFAYYMCFKCKEPYFGGMPRCDDGLDNFDPSELICGACSGIGVAECPKHGKAFVLFKCRFCCSPSSWYCWGTTHFCDSCHRRQEAHDYLTTKSVEELDKCPGPEECPLGIEHPPNGQEYSLGCSLCRGGSSS